MTVEDPSIVSVKEILELSLAIPQYQRPYRWTTESAVLLFNDIYDSYKNKNYYLEYRIGTVVLHKEKDKYNIVDGQQRLTTLAILAYCFDKNDKKIELLNQGYNKLSFAAVQNNYKVLKSKVNDLGDEAKKKNFIDHVMEKCTFVKVVVANEQEAFQFFDSQNSRGKALAPHDLLKAYHLREMNNERPKIKQELVSEWEDKNQKDLASFFEKNLYPIIKYCKNESGLHYSEKDIKTFKGIANKDLYNFAIYHKSANIYIENYNSLGTNELTSCKEINQFQLTQPIIAGRRFFKYTLYYFDLHEKVVKHIDEKNNDGLIVIPNTSTGDEYVKELLVNVVMLFVDKFNFDELKEPRLKFFYKWAYTLRLAMHAVYQETINKYALGTHYIANTGLNLFKKIAESTSPKELDAIVLDDEKDLDNSLKNKEKYKEVYDAIF